ncbi:hypothetical protein CISIN_1g047393mg, partial [Citrus sinensis]
LKLCSLISDVEIPWNLLLKACIKAKDYEMVHELLERIQLCCGFIDSYSICDILNSCLNPILLNVGTQAQAYMTKRGLISHPAVGNCLININSRCGKIDDADLAFKSTPEKNSLSWTFIISARVNHGHPSEALDLFKDKQWRYTSMNPTTFRSALKAYALMGLVGEAYRLFLSMEEVYHIEPSEEHYSIMVEALGRAGMFEEVLEFIKGIVPGKLCPLIWRTLLLSSRVHGDMKLAKYALDKLLELDPGMYVGCWIEIQNKIYEFVSNEELTSEVSDKLAEIEENMKELGFVLNRSLYQTKMKAVALGLISFPHGMPTRVIKSVGMCGYSHSACRFMSTIIERELVVKDPGSFHHFKDGKCSCKDAYGSQSRIL